MSRRVDEHGRLRRLVYDALAELTARGHDRVGPTMISDLVHDNTGERLQTTLISWHLKRLVEEGRVERLPTGPKKALYRIVETI